MTKKDFILVARILREVRPLFRKDQFESILNIFASNFGRTFPRFDPEKFKRFILKD